MVSFNLDMFPMIKSVKFSQAHAVAWASFAIWAYRRSVSDIDREANAMVLLE